MCTECKGYRMLRYVYSIRVQDVTLCVQSVRVTGCYVMCTKCKGCRTLRFVYKG